MTEPNLPTGRRVRVWSFPGGKLVRTIDHAPGFCQVHDERLVCGIASGGSPPPPGDARLLSWRLPDGEPVDMGGFSQKAA